MKILESQCCSEGEGEGYETGPVLLAAYRSFVPRCAARNCVAAKVWSALAPQALGVDDNLLLQSVAIHFLEGIVIHEQENDVGALKAVFE